MSNRYLDIADRLHFHPYTDYSSIVFCIIHQLSPKDKNLSIAHWSEINSFCKMCKLKSFSKLNKYYCKACKYHSKNRSLLDNFIGIYYLVIYILAYMFGKIELDCMKRIFISKQYKEFQMDRLKLDKFVCKNLQKDNNL